MTSSGLSPRCSAPMVTAYRRASYAEPCRISASTLSSPRAWAGCDSMVAIGQDQSLPGAEGNHRGRVARQLGVVADPVGAQMRGWIDGLLASRSAMRTWVMIRSWQSVRVQCPRQLTYRRPELPNSRDRPRVVG